MGAEVGRSGGHSCREFSTETENAQPLGLVEGSEIEEGIENVRQRPRTLDPWFLLDSFAPGIGVGSESQTQRFGMLAGERSENFLERSFYTVKIVCSRISGVSRSVRRSSSPRGADNLERGFSEREVYRRCLCSFVCVRGFVELLSGKNICRAYISRRYVLEEGRFPVVFRLGTMLSRCIITNMYPTQIVIKFNLNKKMFM